MFYEIDRQFLISYRVLFVSGAMSMYVNAEQTTAPICAVCGRRLGIGYYYSCHICSQSYCYAHAPAKCTHLPAKPPAKRAPLVR